MRAYLGIPFAELGRTRDGCDCLGLVMLVYRECLGIELQEPGYAHTRDPNIPALIESEATRWQSIETPQRFDVALFRGVYWHLGIITEPGKMLHVDRGLESSIDHLEPHWLPRLVGYYRL